MRCGGCCGDKEGTGCEGCDGASGGGGGGGCYCGCDVCKMSAEI